MDRTKNCIKRLYQIGAVKFGEFTLKSGILSPIYIDLRLIISYPDLLKYIATLMGEQVTLSAFDRICGVPYTALPIATTLSLEHQLPMVMRRKEIKEYGTKKIIEGSFEKGHNCLLVEDLITSGMSLFETIAPLEQEGLVVSDIIVLLDREQGGRRRLEEKGYRLHAVVNIHYLLSVLKEEGSITDAVYGQVRHFLGVHPC